jgi:hypothetical protein
MFTRVDRSSLDGELWVGTIPHEFIGELYDEAEKYAPVCYHDKALLEDEAFCTRCPYAKCCKSRIRK